MKETIYSKDTANKKMNITREFDAPIELTWKAWTNPEWLDQWWAPKPWKAETKTMDFREGGYWLYCMKGPEGEKHWARADYKKIVTQKYFIGTDAFCDENGNINTEMPRMTWNVEFQPVGHTTKVMVEITFEKEKDMQGIIEMGFEEGFRMAHTNLDALFEKQKISQ